MAELAVSTALFLLEASSLLLNRLDLQEVQTDIDSMKRWLRSMKAFIADSYGREASRMQADQLEKARDIAYNIEDVIDEFFFHNRPYSYHNHKVTRKGHDYCHQIRHGFPLERISKMIASIKREIDDFKPQNELDRYSHPGSSSSSSSNTRHGLRASPLLRDNEMVGYEDHKRELIGRLVDGEKKLLRLAVVGPTGSGKTTLVKNVYWNHNQMFDCHAWVLVSRSFDLEELFVSMLKQFCHSRREGYPSDDGSNTLTKMLKYLAGKRYIAVLDDVCRKEDWDAIKDALPDALCGSRIMITTSSSEVASACAYINGHMLSLKGLESLEGLRLFYRNVFPNGCPYELKDCLARIVERCDGLPLAIDAIGKELAQKNSNSWTLMEWERFHDSLLRSEIKNDPITFVITNAFESRYMDLSSNLKSCLLYFSIFPEDQSVRRGRLVRLWVAEGFSVGKDDQTPEKVAEGYLKELINRHLVDVSNWDFQDRPRSVRVSSLVLNFIKQKCKDENFAWLSPTSPQGQRIRRLSVSTQFNENRRHILAHLLPFGHCRGVRSMFLSVHNDSNSDRNTRIGDFFSWLSRSSASDIEEKLRSIELLKILDIQWEPLTHFPQDIDRLSNLKYLNLSDTRISTIPSSIEKLSHLETLDLKRTDVAHLPKEISHLHKLRNLLAYKCNADSPQGVGISSDISKLKSLQKISLVKVDRKGQILKNLIGMTQLRKLGLTGLDRGHGQDLYAAVGEMRNLTTLDLCLAPKDKEEYLKLDDMISYLPIHTLQRLYLKGLLQDLPDLISSLYNLRRIRLKSSKIEHSPLTALKGLPYLIELQLVNCYVGGELIFEVSGFKKLKIVLIEGLPQLHTIMIEVGAMPELKQISLRKCPKLTMCPPGIEYLLKVEELTLYDMSQKLISRLRRDGEDRRMVERIHVVHSFTSTTGFENLLDS